MKMTDSLKEKVIHRVKEKFPDKPDIEINEAVGRAEEYFLSYTKRKNMPVTAFYLWIDMSSDDLNHNGYTDDQIISSVKRGDTTVSYATDNVKFGFTAYNEKLSQYRVVIAR